MSPQSNSTQPAAFPAPSHSTDLGPAKTVLLADDVGRILDRIAHQILEKTRGGEDVVLHKQTSTFAVPAKFSPLR